MTDYRELVKALRDEDNCNVLSYIDDAADAIEALLESVGMLGQQRSYWIDKAAEYYNQLPKRGEWVYNDGDYIPYCSICGMPQDTETPYCHFCGAKMEVQDAEEN